MCSLRQTADGARVKNQHFETSACPLDSPFSNPSGNGFGAGYREADRDRLRGLYAEARGGSRRLGMLVGEPGIGKTRLAGELSREVHLDGATVLYGRSEEEGLMPYQPFVEAIGHYIASLPAEVLEAQTTSIASDLVRLLPQLAERLPGLPEPLRAEPETERYRLFDAVASLLVAASGEAPVVLVLDDLHWSDKPTLLLLKP